MASAGIRTLTEAEEKDRQIVINSPCDINDIGDCSRCDDKSLREYKEALYRLTKKETDNDRKEYKEYMKKLEDHLKLVSKEIEKYGENIPIEVKNAYNDTKYQISVYKETYTDIEPYIQCQAFCGGESVKCKRNAQYDVHGPSVKLADRIGLKYIRRNYCYQHASYQAKAYKNMYQVISRRA